MSYMNKHFFLRSTLVLGLALLGVVKLLPWIGVWTWTVATLIGVGASLTSKFGRRQPWFQIDELDEWMIDDVPFGPMVSNHPSDRVRHPVR